MQQYLFILWLCQVLNDSLSSRWPLVYIKIFITAEALDSPKQCGPRVVPRPQQQGPLGAAQNDNFSEAQLKLLRVPGAQ